MPSREIDRAIVMQWPDLPEKGKGSNRKEKSSVMDNVLKATFSAQLNSGLTFIHFMLWSKSENSGQMNQYY